MSRIYYVSSKHGNDENAGTQEKPLATLSAVNRIKLEPGDQVLLERGSVFRGQYLHISAAAQKNSRF